MNTCTASGHGLADLAGALQLDLEHHAAPVGQAGVDLGAQRAVAVGGVARVLDELAGGDAAARTPRRP